MACCFFSLAELALACFCEAFLLTDFGDLSPILINFRFFGLLTRRVVGFTATKQG